MLSRVKPITARGTALTKAAATFHSRNVLTSFPHFFHFLECKGLCARFMAASLLLQNLVFVSFAIEARPDGREIIRQSLEAGTRNEEGTHRWISESRAEERQLDPDGSLKSDQIKIYDWVPVQGIYIRKLIAKDGKPLREEDQHKEDQRVEKIVTARLRETESQRAKRLTAEKQKKEKARKFNQEILDAFEFKLLGEESIAGRAAWKIEAIPHPGYKPSDMRAEIFPHVKGIIWVDKQDKLWAKAEADAFEPMSVGFSLIAKLEQGAHLFFEQVRMEDGVWLLRQFGIHAVAHVAVVKRIGIDQGTTYRNFRKLPPQTVVDDTPPK